MTHICPLSQSPKAMHRRELQDSQASEPPNLLSLPSEILRIVFAKVQEADRYERKGDWFTRPENKFTSLLLTCKRLYHEIEDFWPHYDIPFPKLPKLIDKYSSELQRSPVSRMKRYRSISIELDLRAAEILMIGKFLREAKHLEELRLYFKGTDLNGTTVFLHGCGHEPETGRERPLPPEAQRDHLEMIPLWSAILSLTRLRVLVISNANFQLFQTVFQNKPRLQFVHLTADPRSAVHKQFDISTLGRLIEMPKEYFPPVKALQLAANSVLNASALPSNCALTLQHLTWTVPSTSLGSNRLHTSYLRETYLLLENLRLNARRLHTLRICIADKGYMWGGHRVNADLHAGLTSTMAFLTTLRRYELHMTLGRDVWNQSFGEMMFMAIPMGLRRMYANEKWITLMSLDRVITNKYLYADKYKTQSLLNRHHQRNENGQLPERWIDRLSSRHHEHCFDDEQRHALDVTMWINPTTYEPICYDDNEPPLGDPVVRKSEPDLFLPGIIGEDLHRNDYIPMRTGNLGFVAYTYEDEVDEEATELTGETKTQWLLRLNGRLLDRERNLHLRTLLPGEHIPHETKKENSGSNCAETETATSSAQLGISLLLHTLNEVEAINPRDREAAQAELAESPLTDFGRYFGAESEAFEVFRREPVVSVTEVQPYRYCELSDAANDHKCHWLCPEAEVPTQAAWDDMCAKYRAGKKGN